MAIGFLPQLRDTHNVTLVKDRYAVMLRARHPALQTLHHQQLQPWLQGLNYLAISSHSVPWQILRELSLEQNIRLTAAHFLAVPDIVLNTDLAVVMPWQLAQVMAASQQYVLQ